MDWIDPRYAVTTPTATPKAKRRKSKKDSPTTRPTRPLSAQVTAALAQPVDIWASAYDHALTGLRWPAGCSLETTFLWSSLMQEQGEVLVRAGMSAKKLAALIAEVGATTAEEKLQQLASVVGLMDQSLETVAFGWLDAADSHAASALGVAALAWHIPEHARRPGNEWLKQWMQSAVDRVATYTPDLDEAVLCHLVLQCELPLLLGVATAATQRTLLADASQAMDSLAEYLERSEDTPAPWLAHGATYLRASLACVVRCRVLANALGLREWYPPQQRALAELLKHAARWSRPDGTQLLAAGNAAPRSSSMWEALCKQTKNPKSLRMAMTLSGLNSHSRSEAQKKASPTHLPAATYYCEDAAGVCMQSDWRKRGSRFALDFSDNEICIEALGPKGKPLLAGEWTARLELDGQAQLQLDEWGELCWFSDDDVDYLELEAQFGQHARIQRQAVLFREERLLLLADALLCDRAGEWSLSSRMPLAGDVRFEPTKKTTEGFLISPSGARCLAMPLYLPEWRRQILSGSLEVDDDVLVAHQRCNTQRLYVATLISLCNSHAKKAFTWRRLTVGEDLRIVGPDEAVAYRVQIGKEQWVLYRSLAAAKRRTAVGMHTLADFFAGRLDSQDGEVETMVQVEVTA